MIVLNINDVIRTNKIELYTLPDINLTINNGEIVSCMESYRCDKSTLHNIIGLRGDATSETIEFGEINVDGMDDLKLSYYYNRKLCFMLQCFHLIPALNILDNVALSLFYRKDLLEKEKRDRALEVIEKVCLLDHINYFGAQLFGCQNQRVAIAQEIVRNPEIILADGLTGNLDSKIGIEIVEILHDLNMYGTIIIMVTHDRSISGRTGYIISIFDSKSILIVE